MCACLAVLLPAAAALVLSHPNPDPTQSVLKVSGSSYNIFGVSSSTYNKWGSFVLWECSPTCDLFRTGYDAARTMAGASCCTQSFQTSYYNCVSCAGVVIDGTDYTKAQADMDDFYVSCYDRGYPLQKLTLPGQDPSRTPSTYSRVGTSSIHGTLPSGWLTMSEWSPPSEPTTTSMSSLSSITVTLSGTFEFPPCTYTPQDSGWRRLSLPKLCNFFHIHAHSFKYCIRTKCRRKRSLVFGFWCYRIRIDRVLEKRNRTLTGNAAVSFFLLDWCSQMSFHLVDLYRCCTMYKVCELLLFTDSTDITRLTK